MRRGVATYRVRALVDAPELKSRVKGILFLGTAHRGTSFTRFGILAASFFAPLDADVEIMRPLVTDNVDLDDLEKKFSRHFRNAKRMYYFETHKMRHYLFGFIPWIRVLRLDLLLIRFWLAALVPIYILSGTGRSTRQRLLCLKCLRTWFTLGRHSPRAFRLQPN